jgi:hypothetical protein
MLILTAASGSPVYFTDHGKGFARPPEAPMPPQLQRTDTKPHIWGVGRCQVNFIEELDFSPEPARFFESFLKFEVLALIHRWHFASHRIPEIFP